MHDSSEDARRNTGDMRWGFQQLQTSGEKSMQLRAVVAPAAAAAARALTKILTRSGGGGGGSEAIKLIILNRKFIDLQCH